jgi:hypothetical protein
MHLIDEVGDDHHPAAEQHHRGQHHAVPAQRADSGASQVIRRREHLDGVGGTDLGHERGLAGLDQRFVCHGARSPIIWRMFAAATGPRCG